MPNYVKVLHSSDFLIKWDFADSDDEWRSNHGGGTSSPYFESVAGGTASQMLSAALHLPLDAEVLQILAKVRQHSANAVRVRFLKEVTEFADDTAPNNRTQVGDAIYSSSGTDKYRTLIIDLSSTPEVINLNALYTIAIEDLSIGQAQRLHYVAVQYRVTTINGYVNQGIRRLFELVAKVVFRR